MDKVKRIQYEGEELEETPQKKALVVTYKTGDPEIFYLEEDGALLLAERLKNTLQEVIEGRITRGCISITESLNDKRFKLVVVIDEEVRTIRIISPEED